jgi:hypothetical protein
LVLFKKVAKDKKADLGEHGLMVLVWLRGLREFRTKIAQPPQPFPPHLPRAAKIKPKTVRTYYKMGS